MGMRTHLERRLVPVGRPRHDDVRVRTRLYVATLTIAAIAMVAALVAHGFSVGPIWAVVGMAIAALLAENGVVRVSPTLEKSTATLPRIFAAVIAGPLAAVLVTSFGLLLELRRRDGVDPRLRWLSWTASRVLSAGAAGLVAQAIIGARTQSLMVVLAAATSACAADALADLVFASMTVLVRRRGQLVELLQVVGPLSLISVPLYAPLLAILAYAYLAVSPWVAALFVAPAFGLHRLFVLYREQRDSAHALRAANDRLERVNFSFAAALVATLDARDQYTAGHSTAVAIYARDIAGRLRLSSEQQRLAYLCGLVHDIGKIGLPSGLLEKPGKLTPEERLQMEGHPVIGETIVQKVEDYSEVAGIVRHHHERLDGAGYPDQRQGDEIPLLARIIAVADAYNAMTSNRPYRAAMPFEMARERLHEAAGSQFDPVVVEAFDGILAEESDSYRTGRRSDFRMHSDGVTLPLLRAA